MATPPYDQSTEGSLADILFKRSMQASIDDVIRIPVPGMSGLSRLDTTDPHRLRRHCRRAPFGDVPYDWCDGRLAPTAWDARRYISPRRHELAYFARPFPLMGMDPRFELPADVCRYLSLIANQCEMLAIVLTQLRRALPSGCILEVDPILGDITLWRSDEQPGIWRLLLYTTDIES